MINGSYNGTPAISAAADFIQTRWWCWNRYSLSFEEGTPDANTELTSHHRQVRLILRISKGGSNGAETLKR